MTSRGMTWIDVILPEKYKLDTKFLEKHLCSECLKKVAGSLEYWKNETEDENKEAIPLSLIAFDTLEIYSLQEYYRSCFIKDYYIEIDPGSDQSLRSFPGFLLSPGRYFLCSTL